MYELTLSGPAKNALGTAMLTFVRDGLRAAAGRPVLLTGAGDAFSAGLNLKEVAGLDPRGMADFLRLLEDVMTALYTYPGPTAAAVNGHAIAGGAILALCCDYRVATANPGARLGLNEVAIGLRFPPRILAIVRQRVPKRHVDEVLLGAALCDPAEAARLGLVDEVSEDPVARARAKLEAWSRHPPAAYAATKADLRAATVALAPEDDARFVDEVVPVWTSDAVRARILAVLKK